MRRSGTLLVLVATFALGGCGGSDSREPITPGAVQTQSSAPSTLAACVETPAVDDSPDGTKDLATKPEIEIPDTPPPCGLVTGDIVVGTGAAAATGQKLVVKYVGVTYMDGKQFDASWDTGRDLPFTLGAGEVIPGWDQGIVGMKVGGRRSLVIPPDLAYGAQGRPPIPPNATLVFVIDLVKIG